MLVTDAYSKKIVGLKLADHLRTEIVVEALKMVLKQRSFPNHKLIHHSDRGIQYYAPEFTDFTDKQQITLSNTQNSDPYENAIAERINRTVKYQYALKEVLPDFKTAEKMVRQAVEI